MDLLKITVMAGQAPAALPGQAAQLLIQVKPLQHALPVQEFPAAQLAKLVAGNCLALCPQVLPKLQQSRKIGFFINESLMRLIRRGLEPASTIRASRTSSGQRASALPSLVVERDPSIAANSNNNW